MEKIYKKTCELCGKEIVSLFEAQCNYNFEAHRISCEKKNLKEDSVEDEN